MGLNLNMKFGYRKIRKMIPIMPPGPVIMPNEPFIMPNEPMIMPNEPIIMNPNPQLDMKPAGSLNIPRFEDIPIGRVEEEKYHIRNPKYVPSKYEPIKFEMPKDKPIKLEPFKLESMVKIEPIKLEPIKIPEYTPIKIKAYEPPPSFELFPKKNFWDKD